MNASLATLERMARKKPGPAQNAPEPGHEQRAPLSARVPAGLAKRFIGAVDRLRPKTSASAVIEMLIEQWLATLPAEEGGGE